MLRPAAFISGAGIGGILTTLRAVYDMRRAAARYLARRGLAAPEIPWAQMEAAKAEGKAKGEGSVSDER